MTATVRGTPGLAVLAVLVLFATLSATRGVAYAGEPSTVTGSVFEDLDGDGVWSPGEPTVPDVLVAWEGVRFARTDDAGRFSLELPGEGIVWARSPSGFAPAPSWAVVTLTPGGAHLDLPLRRLATPPGERVRFVDASDSHSSADVDLGELRAAFAQAFDLDVPVEFLVITGDLTDHTELGEFDVLREALGFVPVPFVPVPGNHDWYDGGPVYRAVFGPPQYAFDFGPLHVLVLNFNQSVDSQIAFARAELATAPPHERTVVFSHAPLPPRLASALEELGVDDAFTGHFHANRVIDHGALREYNTEPLVFGGLDGTPSGYRVVELGVGAPTIEHYTTLRGHLLELAWPRAGTCVERGDMPILVAEASGAHQLEIFVQVNDRPEQRLAPVGGWIYQGALADLPLGKHGVRVRVVRDGLEIDRRDSSLCVVAPAPPGGSFAVQLPEWSQQQGDAAGKGARDATLAPPLVQVWAQPLGGHALGAQPIVARDVLIAPVVDLADGAQGGVVAFDARTGAPRWVARDGHAVRATPAAVGELVIYATSDATLRARRISDGKLAWQSGVGVSGPVGDTWLYAPPAVLGDEVFVGTSDRFVALDAATGVERWRREWNPDAAPIVTEVRGGGAALTGDVGVIALRRVPPTTLAFDARTGDERWRAPFDTSVRVTAPPVIVDDLVVFAEGQGSLRAFELATGAPRWTQRLYDANGYLDIPPTGAAAVSGHRMFWPTPRGLYAIDARSGEQLWQAGAGDSLVRILPYSMRSTGFYGAVAVTGDVVWAGGVDGVLYGLAASDGRRLTALDLGAPILSGVVPAGDLLFVATYDGVVRAFRGQPEIADDADGCGCRVARRRAAGGGVPLGALAVVLVLVLVRRRRRHR